MVGRNKETDFSLDNYEEFYEDHHFQPLSDEDAYNAHEVIPRFGWAYDRAVELQPKSYLDIGCLDGSLALTIGVATGAKVTGIDLTKDGIEIARGRAEEAGLDAEFIQGYAEDVLEQFATDGKKFDLITFFEIIEHVKDVPRLLKAIDAVLAPGGTILCSTPDFESPYYGKDDEQNKCHVRLYTTADEDYEAVNKYGTLRKATSITKEIGKDRIKTMGVYSELINVEYK